MSESIAFVYNTAKYLYRFRADLIRALQKRNAHVIAMTPYDESVDDLREMGVRTIPINLRSHSVNPLHDIRTLRELTRKMRRERPQVVLNFTIKPVIYGSLAAKRAGVSEIYSMIPGLGLVFARNDFRSRVLQNVIALLYRLSLRQNRKVFFQNVADRDLFMYLDIVRPDQCVVVSGSGVDTELFRPQHDVKSESVVFMASRLLWHKGISQFIQSAQIVKKKLPGARFVLAGFSDGSRDSVSLDYLYEQTRHGRIEFIGELVDVKPWIARSRCIVLPSFYREGLPRFLLEGMAMAKPIVTTRIPGCRDLVEEGVNGYLVAPREADQLADAIARLLNDPQLAAEMGKRSRQIVVERYDVKKVNGQMLAEIDRN